MIIASRARQTRFFSHLVLVLLCIFALSPLYWMVATSLKPLNEALQVPPTIIPNSVSISTYIDIFADTLMARWIVNSLVVGLLTAGGNVLFGALAGYALARIKFRGRQVLLMLVLASFMIPFEATFIANFVLIRDLGWYNTYAALVVPWVSGAFAVFMFRQEFMGLPDDLFDSAYVDGSSEFRAFWSIGLPLVRAGAITVFLITFIWSWNALLWPLFVTSGSDMRVVQLGLVSFVTEGGVFVNLLMAAAVIGILPVAILFFIGQKFVIEGITQGGLK
jgi:multiple sugar transport system permease protein